jgi:predicted 2-oxoglutarate/Fe(II)-dependent dioxygenase YbiX
MFSIFKTEPRWKSYIVKLNNALFTPEQCNDIINCGISLQKEEAGVGIGLEMIEFAQYTEYNKSSHYNWHMDSEIEFSKEPPVRKISMSILLSDPKEFVGGELEFIEEGKPMELKKGEAVFFASFIRHRVKPVKKGIRKSLVMWFGGEPFK